MSAVSTHVFGVFLKEHRGLHDVIAALARHFGVDPRRVGTLEAEGDYDIRFERYDRDHGYAVQLDLYANPGRTTPTTSSALAAALARSLREDVAYSDESLNPYTWLVVDPRGHVEKRSQRELDAEGLVLEDGDGA